MCEENEEWRPARYLKKSGDLVYFKGVEVSSFGRVRRISDGFEYKQHDEHGYLFWSKGPIHRLVMSSFTDNIDGSLDVNHKDEDKTNNHLYNLEWMTRKANQNHGTRNERISAALTGKPKSDEHKRKISENHVGVTGKHWELVDGKRVYY